MPPSLSERFERSVTGRVVISITVLLLVLLEVATHLPTDTALHRSVGDPAHTAIRIAASEQQWGVFAPDPRSTSLRIEGRVNFEDGTTVVWHLPEGPRLGANLRFSRWRRWLERVRSDGLQSLWEPTARWIASEYDGGPSPVAGVQLVRMFHPNTLRGGDPPAYDEFVYYTYVPSEDDGGA